MGVAEDITKISNAAIFLREAAQLWWRRKHTEMVKGLYVIDTWEQLKAKLRKQFVPHNANDEVLSKLQRLRQTGSIMDYVKEFTTMMLEAPNLSDYQLLFNFKDRLKDWAKIELDYRGVKTLDDVIAIVESICDYSARAKGKQLDSSKSGGDVEASSDDDERSSRSTHKDFRHKESNHQNFYGGNSKQGKSPSSKNGATKPSQSYFICDGPHWMRDCPSK